MTCDITSCSPITDSTAGRMALHDVLHHPITVCILLAGQQCPCVLPEQCRCEAPGPVARVITRSLHIVPAPPVPSVIGQRLRS